MAPPIASSVSDTCPACSLAVALRNELVTRVISDKLPVTRPARASYQHSKESVMKFGGTLLLLCHPTKG